MSFRQGNLLLLAPILFGCREPKASTPAEAGTTWRLSSLPAAEIGVGEGDQPYELSGATSSLRLGDGRIVVANSGSHELRVFDSEGRFQRAIGRKGSGPGEFDGSLQLSPAGIDRFTVYDVNQQKLSMFDTAGTFLAESRVLADGLHEFPLSVWLFRANWINGPVDTLRRPAVAAVLDQLENPASGGYRFVKVADDGRLWVQRRQPGDSISAWQIYSPGGQLLANIAIPGEVEIHQIGSDFLTVRAWGANDVERIQLFRIEGGSSSENSPVAGKSKEPVARISDQAIGDLAREVRNLVTVQEMHYADHNGYATRASDLANWTPPEGMEVHLMAADKRGWVGLLAHRIEPALCGMAVGGSTPPGWREGSPKCSLGTLAEGE